MTGTSCGSGSIRWSRWIANLTVSPLLSARCPMSDNKAEVLRLRKQLAEAVDALRDISVRCPRGAIRDLADQVVARYERGGVR